MGDGDLGSVLRKRWRMGQILFSGLIPGWEGFRCVRGLGACLTWQGISLARWMICSLLGGRLTGRRRCGGGSCGCGRRRC
jgi:hypothetical protein